MDDEMIKKRVLFVDDEPNILAGMNRMLRPLRKILDIHFTESGKEALFFMENEPFDIVVSDMRMPGMDGAQLLKEIRSLYPQTIRIMLSGQADNESIIRTVTVAHQFLAKPCEPERLKNTLHRSCLLHSLLTHPVLRKIVTKLDTLPSLPAIYMEIQRLLGNADTSVGDVAACVSKDLSMSAKLLQLVNSSFFGLYENVENPEQAVHLLGLDTIKTLVLAEDIFSQFDSQEGPLSMVDLWQHGLFTGGCAKAIAQAETAEKDIINNAFLAGMLHDIGKLILMTNIPTEYQEIIERAQQQDIELYDSEVAILKSGHPEVGAYLLGLWGFNTSVIEALVYHHRPDKCPGSSFDAVTAVHVANCLCRELVPPPIGKAPSLSKEYLAKIGCNERLPVWRKICAGLSEGKHE